MTKTGDVMTAAMDALVLTFPGCAITLLIAPPSKPGEKQDVNYIGNADRDQVRRMMKELLARWEDPDHKMSGRMDH